MKDIQFKDVPMFGTFFQYNQQYVKTSETKCSWNGHTIEADPTTWVKVKEDGR